MSTDYCASFVDTRNGVRTYCIVRQRSGESYEAFVSRIAVSLSGRDYKIADIRVSSLRSAKLDGHIPRDAAWGSFHYSY